jgi:hypothetical protein
LEQAEWTDAQLSNIVAAFRAMREEDRLARLCLARTRSGAPCQRRKVPGRSRCPNHGGLSTGPRTKAGRSAVAASNRRRAKPLSG